MKILNLGSLNIDKVYSVEHFVRRRDDLVQQNGDFQRRQGPEPVHRSGARAEVYHAGAIGPTGRTCGPCLRIRACRGYLQTLDTVTGHAVIQLTPKGQNCIIISAGANGELTERLHRQRAGPFRARRPAAGTERDQQRGLRHAQGKRKRAEDRVQRLPPSARRCWAIRWNWWITT